jgi:hypothetical protein
VACASSLATAEPGNPCNAPASAVRLPYVDGASGAAGYPCAPSPIGSGTLPTLRSNAAGSVVWWYCPSASGRWTANWAAATAARLSARNAFAEASAVIKADDPMAAFRAAVDRNVSLPLSDPSLTPVWCPFVTEMLSGAPPASVAAPSSAATPVAAPPAVKAVAVR